MGVPRARRASVVAALSSGLEAPTEALQEVIALTARDLIDENFEAFGPEGRSRILNAGFAGLAVGFVAGGIGGAVTRNQQIDNSKDALAGLEDVPEEGAPPALPQRDLVVTAPARAQTVTPQGDLFLNPLGQEALKEATETRDAAREASTPLNTKTDEIALESMQDLAQQLEIELEGGLTAEQIADTARGKSNPRLFKRVSSRVNPAGLIIIGQAGHVNTAQGTRENILEMNPDSMTFADVELAREGAQSLWRLLQLSSLAKQRH